MKLRIEIDNNNHDEEDLEEENHKYLKHRRDAVTSDHAYLLPPT